MYKYICIYTYVPESHEPGHAGMKPSDHVPTPEIDEIAGFKKKKTRYQAHQVLSLQIRKVLVFFWGEEYNEDMPNKCAQSFSDFTLVGQSPLVALSRLQRFQEVSKVTLNKCAKKYVYINKRQVYGHMP